MDCPDGLSEGSVRLKALLSSCAQLQSGTGQTAFIAGSIAHGLDFFTPCIVQPYFPGDQGVGGGIGDTINALKGFFVECSAFDAKVSLSISPRLVKVSCSS